MLLLLNYLKQDWNVYSDMEYEIQLNVGDGTDSVAVPPLPPSPSNAFDPEIY
jgi:hypothetical protein